MARLLLYFPERNFSGKLRQTHTCTIKSYVNHIPLQGKWMWAKKCGITGKNHRWAKYTLLSFFCLESCLVETKEYGVHVKQMTPLKRSLQNLPEYEAVFLFLVYLHQKLKLKI